MGWNWCTRRFNPAPPAAPNLGPHRATSCRPTRWAISRSGGKLAAVIEQVRAQTSAAESPSPAAIGPKIPQTQFDVPSENAAPAQVSPAPTETVSRLSIALSTQRSDRQAEYFRTVAQLMIQAAE